jgi:hypothetical protein
VFKNIIVLIAVATFVVLGITESFAAPIFSGTSNSSQWEVATNVGGVDGQFSSFPTSGFVTATPIANRPEWIANNATGTNGSIGTWTFFVFRQSFDMTGYDPTTAHLQFQWAADDSGQSFATRGSWKPKFSLNSSPLVTGVWPNDYSYSYGSTVDLSSGFVSGLNKLVFYVEGNGVTDGFALRTIGLTANPVPEPDTWMMMLLGSGLVSWQVRRKRPSK